MKILYSWLNDFVDLSQIDRKEVFNNLERVGFEIEEVIELAKGLDNVVVSKILDIKQHDNADKLVVCQVDIGAQKTVQIVTGAKNMKVGDSVPLALNGANLPNGQKIVSGEIRGEKSEGMFCGGDEVGVTEEMYKGAGTYGLLILNKGEKVGTKLSDALHLNDVIFDVKVTPNRPDVLSVLGVAREVAAAFNLKLKMPNLSYKGVKQASPISVNVENYNECERYMGAYIANINNGESPSWLKQRLTLVGHKPHSLFVDITNYVLCEMGQPMHAFDAEKIKGNKLIIRNSSNEKLVTLDEKERILSGELAICDIMRPLVIAGIMGGEESGTFGTTKNVFLESAVFSYNTIRRNSRKLGVSSDSSQRYSKGVYFDSAELGLKRALSLIYELNGGTIYEQVIDNYKAKPVPRNIEVSVKRLNDRLALSLTSGEIVKILNALEFKTIEKGDNIICIPPTYRNDIEKECDISEEIGRQYGYDNISIDNSSLSSYVSRGNYTLGQTNINLIKNLLVSIGGYEVVNFQFISPSNVQDYNLDVSKHIEIINPLGRDYSLLRQSLIPGLLNTTAFNLNKKNKNLFLFEIAKIFEPKCLPLKELPIEKVYCSSVFCGEGTDFYSVKSKLNLIAETFKTTFDFRPNALMKNMHPGICADVYMFNRKIGYIGEIHPAVCDKFNIGEKVYAFEIDLTSILERKIERKHKTELPKQPSIERDLAFVVEKDILASQILNVVKSSDKAIIESAKAFDVYEGTQVGEGKKSVAIKIAIRQPEKTLADNEINEIMNKIIGNCEKFIGAILRK